MTEKILWFITLAFTFGFGSSWMKGNETAEIGFGVLVLLFSNMTFMIVLERALKESNHKKK